MVVALAEGFEEGVGELGGVEGLLREVGDGLFDFDGVHWSVPVLVRPAPVSPDGWRDRPGRRCTFRLAGWLYGWLKPARVLGSSAM
jgi:hypothetical protein